MRILVEDVGREPKEVVVDLKFRGVGRDNHGNGYRSSRQVQVADQAAALIAQATTSVGASN